MKLRCRKLIALALSCAIVSPYAAVSAAANTDSTITVTYNYFESGGSHTRQMEKLDRGLVAYQCATGIYVGWRLLGDEATVSSSTGATSSDAPDFILYRDGEEIAEVAESTNYVDTEGTLTSSYTVAATSGAYSGQESDAVTPWSSGTNYYDIAITPPADDVVTTSISPTYTSTDSDGNTTEVSDGYGAVTNSDGTYTYTFTYSPNDTSVGDLDGDGEYELVVKWMPSNSRDNMGGYTSPVYLMAYELDGTRMWSDFINLGQNVQAGAHHTQFLVYDFDQDGVAEVMCQTAPGSKDSANEYVSSKMSGTSQSYTDDSYYPTYTVDSDGYARYGYFTGYTSQGSNAYCLMGIGNNITSAEYLTVFEGKTGEAIDTIDFPILRYSATCWGDNFGNRCNRFLADVAYLDGETPTAVYWRGYYYGQSSYGERTGIAGINFDGSSLSVNYRFDTLSSQPGYQSAYADFVGQGNHNLTVADVDDDGYDEVISGAMCVEAGSDSGNGYDYIVPKWCTFRGHGDALHIGNYDPNHEGLEFYTVHEEGGGGAVTPYLCTNGTSAYASETVTLDYGQSVIDPQTGETLFHEEDDGDTGRGIMANIGADGVYQFWGVNTYYASAGSTSFTETSISGDYPSNFRIFWDGDLYDELLDSEIIDYDADLGATYTNTAIDGNFNNSTKNNVCLQADLFGDWREEVIVWDETDDGTVLRIYASAIPTDYKMPTLMHDPVYRSGVAAEQTAYNQPPHIGYYVDTSKASSVIPDSEYEGNLFSEDFDSATSATSAWNSSYTSYMTYSLIGDDDKKCHISAGSVGDNRCAILPFTDVSATDKYVIQFDAAFKYGNAKASQIAVLQSDATFEYDSYSKQNALYGTTGGYLFMLTADAYSTSWTLYNSNAESTNQVITLPTLSMCRFIVTISDGTGYLTVYNLSNNTLIAENLEFTADTDLAPQNLYYCAGKAYSEMVIDNISISSLAPDSIEVSPTAAPLSKGGTQQLTITADPSSASTDVTWESSNTNVATVDENGLVTAVAAGTATITATSAYNSAVTAECAITVNPTVTVSSGGSSSGGTVTATSGEVTYASNYSFTYTVNPGYKVEIDGTSYYTSGTYAESSITEDTEITVTYSALFSVDINRSTLTLPTALQLVAESGEVSDVDVSETGLEAGNAILTVNMINSDDNDSGAVISSYTVTVKNSDETLNESFTPNKSDLFGSDKYYAAQVYGDGIDDETDYTVTAEITYTVDSETYTYTQTASITTEEAEKTLKQYYYYDSTTGANVALFCYQ